MYHHLTQRWVWSTDSRDLADVEVRALHAQVSADVNSAFSCLFPADIWYQICGLSTLKTLHMLRAVRSRSTPPFVCSRSDFTQETSKEMQNIVDSRSVWIPFMIKFTKARPSTYSVDDFEEMSVAQLREAAVRMVLVDRAYASPTLPHRPILLFSGQEVDNFSTVVLFPGGERLLIVRDDGTLQIYDIESKTFISHSAKPLCQVLLNICSSWIPRCGPNR